MAKKTGPYVGVTGFMERAEVELALKCVPSQSSRRLMVGILVSSKTLSGQQNRWPGRYPKIENVPDLLIQDERVLNLIHYNTDETETLYTQLNSITQCLDYNLDGFQLNIAWPPISQLEDWHETHPNQFLLLQIGSKAMAAAESMEHFRDLVGAYLPMIDAILIDPSGGKGEPLDPVKGAEYLRSASCHLDLGLGIAGGLDASNLSLLEPLVKEFPDLSIDAEGRLRTRNEDDDLAPGAMIAYLNEAFARFPSK